MAEKEYQCTNEEHFIVDDAATCVCGEVSNEETKDIQTEVVNKGINTRIANVIGIIYFIICATWIRLNVSGPWIRRWALLALLIFLYWGFIKYLQQRNPSEKW